MVAPDATRHQFLVRSVGSERIDDGADDLVEACTAYVDVHDEDRTILSADGRALLARMSLLYSFVAPDFLDALRVEARRRD